MPFGDIYTRKKPTREQRRRWDRQHKYGLSPAMFNRIFERQEGCCAICERPLEDTIEVDHCHSTGQIRGLLCPPCNKAIGLLDDDPIRAFRAADYLAEPS